MSSLAPNFMLPTLATIIKHGSAALHMNHLPPAAAECAKHCKSAAASRKRGRTGVRDRTAFLRSLCPLCSSSQTPISPFPCRTQLFAKTPMLRKRKENQHLFMVLRARMLLFLSPTICASMPPSGLRTPPGGGWGAPFSLLFSINVLTRFLTSF